MRQFRLSLSKGEKGFILLELIVVLFLMALIVGLSAVYWANGLPTHKFNAAVRNLGSSIKQARALSRIHNEKQAVLIDLESKTYAIEGHSVKELPSDVSIMITDPVAGEISEGQYRFIMYPTGGYDGGTIILSNGKRTVSISLDPIVGTLVVK